MRISRRQFLSLIFALALLGVLFLLIKRSREHPNPLLGGSGGSPVYKFDSSYFPDGFIWGTAISSYQTEGEAFTKGRKPSIWDAFTHDFPERIVDGSNGDVATDFYNHYKDDIKKMKWMGMNAFRFSISWSRIIPSGSISDGVNEEGIEFYLNVIKETISNGLEPFVTLFHWDVPQDLEKKYNGFRSPQIVSDFKDYAELCFERFGHLVKHWITLNEPYIFSADGYDIGGLAPGRCSKWVDKACQAGDSATEPYQVGYHLLLSHAEAFRAYKRLGLDGEIGITLDVTWPVPYSDSMDDHDASKKSLDFAFGWFMGPITYGQYPKTMLNTPSLRQRLPKITNEQSELLRGSYDFVGINYYTSDFASAKYVVDPDPTHIRCVTDSHVNLTKYKDGEPIGVQAAPDWLYVYPEGLKYVLRYIKVAYDDPIIYITENGIGDKPDLSPADARKDIWRIQYTNNHLFNLHRAICEYKVKIKGYFAWSFIDNFEWSNGYTVRMGFYQVDHKLRRRPKNSAAWFRHFLQNKDSTGGPKCGFLEPTIDDESYSKYKEEL